MFNNLDDIKQYAKENFLPIMSEECENTIIDILKNNDIKKILEIGTCVGYSSTIMLQNSNAVIDTIEIDEKRVEQAKQVWKNYRYLDRVNSYLGDVDKILEDVCSNKIYDFIFIDGPKSRYKNHLITCLKHTHKGSIILADDVLFFGLVKGQEKVNHKHRTIVRHLREFLDYIENSNEIEVNILNEGNGIAVMKKI